MGVKSFLLSAIQNRLQARWIGQPEYAKAIRRRNVSKPENRVGLATYFGVDVGAQTTANDSGSILWKPEWV